MNVKKILFLVSRRQFAEWSLPSKAGYISFWIGLVGLLLAIATSYPLLDQYIQPTEQTVRKQLAKMLKERRFADAADLLAKIESRDDLKNTYFFYKGTFAIESDQATPVEPSAFFRKISPGSDLFYPAVQNERAYYSRQYGSTDKPVYYRKVGLMLDDLSNLGWTTPAYYALRAMVESNSDSSFQRLIYWNREFDSKYKKYLDRSTYDGIKISTTGGGNSNFRLDFNDQSFALVPEVYFLFALNIARKSGGLCENVNEKTQALNIMQTAIAARLHGRRQSIIESIGEHFSMRFKGTEVEAMIQWLISMEQYCKANNPHQGSPRDIVTQRQ